jgi:hypothetical protein
MRKDNGLLLSRLGLILKSSGFVAEPRDQLEFGFGDPYDRTSTILILSEISVVLFNEQNMTWTVVFSEIFDVGSLPLLTTLALVNSALNLVVVL